MKKLPVVFVIVLALFNFAACSKQKDDSEAVKKNLVGFYVDFGCATVKDADFYIEDAQMSEIGKPYGISSETDLKAALDKISDGELKAIRVDVANGMGVKCKEVFENIEATPEYYAEMFVTRF